jgi:hypothetical protein
MADDSEEDMPKKPLSLIPDPGLLFPCLRETEELLSAETGMLPGVDVPLREAGDSASRGAAATAPSEEGISCLTVPDCTSVFLPDRLG